MCLFPNDTTDPTPHTSTRILMMVIDYQPPNARIIDLLLRYQVAFQKYNERSHHQVVDFYFICTNNYVFDDETSSCAQAATASDSTIPYLTLQDSLAKPILEACPYCQQNSPWHWSAYMAPLLAVNQLKMTSAVEYDFVWASDPDTEFLGDDVAQWFIDHSPPPQNTGVSSPLLSTLIMPSIATAKQHLDPGMYTRIQSSWIRWPKTSSKMIDFGVFTYLTRYSHGMLAAVEANLIEAEFVETFLPYVCKKEFPEHVCRATSLPASNVGFMNNAGNVFTGEKSAQNFQAVALAFGSQVRDFTRSSNRSNIRWYHPLKFPESWTSLPAPTKDGVKADSCKYDGKLWNLKCMMPACDEQLGTIDNCIYYQPIESVEKASSAKS